MLKCKICGHEFSPVIDNHYISRDKEVLGGMVAAISKSEPCKYDTFDCPVCGCQVIAQERKRVDMPPIMLTKKLIIPNKDEYEEDERDEENQEEETCLQ